jgi:polyisoprenoid-binding protein YceI
MGWKICCAATLALSLAACGAAKLRPSAPPGGAAPQPPSTPADVYRIDPAHSELRVLVYRAGPLAALGHDHAIVNRTIGGWVQFGGAAAAASFSLTVPAAGFIVDDAAVRRDEGPQFAEETPEDAKAGTLRNMLSPAVLDAGRFPAISIRSVAVTEARGAFEATLSVNVAGHDSTLVVPFSLERSSGRLTASGAFTLRQSELGLIPFSVFLGALRVQDEMRVKFNLVAVAGGQGAGG